MKKIKMKNIGPLDEADIILGDLTVFVGGQAMGKSIALETIKLVEDAGYIHQRLESNGYDCSKPDKFFSLYYGSGKEKIWANGTTKVEADGKVYTRDSLFEIKRTSVMKNFYIPAQRVVVIQSGWPTGFQGFDSMYPFVPREFSENIKRYMDISYSDEAGQVFPQNNRLESNLKEKIEKSIFLDYSVQLKSNEQNRKMLMLITKDGVRLPITTWSSGQREFVPLLCGLYFCLPAGGTRRRKNLSTIIIEELEMGLHPSAIIDILLIVMELLSRGYKVILSTHSTTVLDVLWAIQSMKKEGKDPVHFLNLFKLRKNNFTSKLAENVLSKTFKTYYFHDKDTKTIAVDISDLDPASTSSEEAGWGGLTEFSGAIAEIVANIVQARQFQGKIQNDKN
jgi:AAA15 family ATPase/GTPase